MTYSNYYVQGMCMGIALAGDRAVFEKCECFQIPDRYGNCENCIKSKVMRQQKIFPAFNPNLETQVNFMEDKK